MIEKAKVEDLQGINAIYNYYVLNSNATFDTEQWSIERRKDWFKQFNHDESNYHLLVAKQDNDVVAFAYNGQFKEKQAYFTSSEMTVYVRADSTQHGLGTQLYQQLISLIEGSQIHRLYSVIALPNEGSIKLHEKFEFHLVGTLDEVGFKNDIFHSVSFYEKKLKN